MAADEEILKRLDLLQATLALAFAPQLERLGRGSALMTSARRSSTSPMTGSRRRSFRRRRPRSRARARAASGTVSPSWSSSESFRRAAASAGWSTGRQG